VSTELRAGRLSASLEGAELVDVRWGGLDIASRIQVTVRDPGWGTVPTTLRSSSIEQTANAFHVVIEATHQNDDVGFAWRGEFEGDDTGALRFAIDGLAERSFDYRRIGICVLHPARSYTGAAYRVTDGSGFVEGKFRAEITPQLLIDERYHPMIEAFSVIDIRFPGRVSATFSFEGEWFELEDQRNWTDASFKTYPTPLERSEPRTLVEGTEVTQSMSLQLRGRAPAARVVDEVTVVQINGPTDRTMPPIGLVAPGDPTLGPAHLRLDVEVVKGDDGTLRRAAALGAPLEVAFLVDEDASGIEAIAPSLTGLPLARVLIHLTSGATTPGALVREVRARLGERTAGVPVVGGTSSHFSELNRLPPDTNGVDAVAFAVSPTVHARDERSMMETLEIQTEVARQAQSLAHGLPLVVSPVAIEAHVGTPFADAWTVGSVAALAAGGAVSLTYAAPTPALSVMMGLRDLVLANVTVSHPQRIAAIAVGSSMVIANLTPQEQRIRVSDDGYRPMYPYEVRVVSVG
jgi:D-apionolactonase